MTSPFDSYKSETLPQEPHLLRRDGFLLKLALDLLLHNA